MAAGVGDVADSVGVAVSDGVADSLSRGCAAVLESSAAVVVADFEVVSFVGSVVVARDVSRSLAVVFDEDAAGDGVESVPVSASALV
ncbi:hypothetical protein [Micropruina sp.]|uniref:hypothetical protein n=1 Tax=Micropruina sp. TaxID=2737536 RepID=UPI0039E42580